MDSIYDLWRQILLALHEEITDTAFNVWIKPIIPLEMTAKDFVLKVPSTMHKEIVGGRFIKDNIKPLIKEFVGIDMNVVLVVEDDIENLHALPAELNETNYEYTFDTFIVGSTNQFAYAAAQAISQNPGGIYNPLFIYGQSGLGKTHLLFAIRDRILRSNPTMNITYIKGDQFTNELIESLGSGTMYEFRKRYRYTDVFLMDDVQFIGGKDSTQEEFFHTFNNLYEEHKQIVLTSDRPPKEIQTLVDRLRNRFESGLLADIQPPDFETRVAIVKRKASYFNLNMPDETAEYIASMLKSNIRQLEGVVKKMNIMCVMDKEKPTISTAQNVIKEIINNVEPLPVTIDRIVTEVSRAFEVDPEDIYSKKRAQPLSRARHACLYCVRECTSLSFEEIGAKFGNRDHTSVIYAVQRAQELMDERPDFRALIQDIINNIKS